MTIIRQNGKVTTTTRALRRDRRHARKTKACQTSGKAAPKDIKFFGNLPANLPIELDRHLANLRLQVFNYNAKQSRRWLRARILGENNDFIPESVASELAKHLKKTEFQLQHPRIIDAVLTSNAKKILSELELERDMASAEQAYPERVQDWWAAPTIIGKKKRKKGKLIGKKEGAAASLEFSDEGIRDGVSRLKLGEKEGMVEEEGIYSPLVLSPTGSMVGEGNEKEEWLSSMLVSCAPAGFLPSRWA